MTTKQFALSCGAAIVGIAGLASHHPVQGFVFTTSPISYGRKHAHVDLSMGLYDQPLPPRPPPRGDGNDKKKPLDEDLDDEELFRTIPPAVSERLFCFDESGKEVNDLLPALGRRLGTGVGCYFEPTDRAVQNLVDKTSCAVEDACWALEATKGDLQKASIRISMARRMQLNTDRVSGLLEQDEDWDEEEYEIEMAQEFQQGKEMRKQAQDRQDREDLFMGGTKDAKWLPNTNPQPIDDEPWFTG